MPNLDVSTWVLLGLVVLLAITFDFINGFHDTANAIATVVATRVLSAGVAIIMAAVLNFVGALTGQAVAKTITGGLVSASAIKDQLSLNGSQLLVIAALIGAIIWNLITWYYGIPSSSSHALIGGVVGAGIAALGFGNVIWEGLLNKVVLPLIISPVIGFIVSVGLMKFLFFLFAKAPPSRVGGLFRRLQLLSAAFMAFSHGSNDAQKTMGVMTLSLFSAGILTAPKGTTPNIPWEVIMIAATAMAFGTAAGGWRIMRTMGNRLVHLEPIHGFAAETTAATVIETASRLGFPLSTTHVISSCILGVGAARRITGVRWSVAFNMVRAWVYTIPVCMALGFVAYFLIHLVFPS